MSQELLETAYKTSTKWRTRLRSMGRLSIPTGLVFLWCMSFLVIILEDRPAYFALITFILLPLLGLVFLLIKKDTVQSFMLSYLKHEVRTPLNTLLGLLSEFQSEIPHKVQLKKDLSVLHRSALRLNYLLEDAMNAEEIENGNFKLKADVFSLRTLISDLDSIFSRVCNEKNIKYSSHIESSLPDKFKGDERRIAQVLWNLLHNACKFTEKGSVRLSVVENKTLMHEEPTIKNLSFEVSDTGIGMQQNEINVIFDKFVTSKLNNDSGTGLGLWISKKILVAMSAHISVKSELNKGSSFKFTLNLDLDHIYNRSQNFKRVLIVEDSVDALNLIKLYLGKIKTTRFEFATSIKSAKNKLINSKFDAVFLDYRLPDGHGVDFLKQVKATYPNVFWVAMSADHTHASEFDATLSKPMRKDDLLKFFTHKVISKRSKAA